MAKPILVLAEQHRGEIADITFEMLGAARAVAGATGAPVFALLLGSDAVPLTARLGAADKVFLVDTPTLDAPVPSAAATALKTVQEQAQADLVFIGCTNISLGIGPILATRTGLPLVNFCRALRVEGNALVCTSQLFGGKIAADVKLPDMRGIVCLYPGAFPAEAGRGDKPPAVEKVPLLVDPPKVIFKQYLQPETGDVDITKQSVLVGVGRGIQTQDNVQLAEELAQALGGAVCASRPVIDQGWLPLSRQVGKSGLSVKPRVYLAFGISGAPEHWEGIQNSQCIIAINTDSKAPIFDGAHYGAVADALEVLPVLIEKVKARKG
ncbi:MAG: electron transfer flavoprotein subunit alpha/FixB family protein [Verrucomicrobiae bacterium]|nr:electron transfer flavoprotein subunit alpha/FixB family protein [Verrucomicrobiae bacterium]MCX7722577.1 electron transfer flavoprotein subunit alpha/FixB family protein [Verrucomicrobiae bacterium]MDW7979401.1 electron transfer flavoprotein subunit alpha/FixB family protein [Verrucomicrobiales bacterium]